MPAGRRGEILRAWMQELERLCRGSMLEWSPDGKSFLREVADWAEATTGPGPLVSTLRDVPVESGPVEAEQARSTATLLFVRDPSGWGDPESLVKRAADRVSPGGTLVLSLPAGPELDGRAADLAALLVEQSALVPREPVAVGSERMLIARRPGERLRVALLPDAPGACLQIRTLGPLEQLESRGLVELRLLPSDADGSHLADRDLLILQRFGGLPAVKLMLAAKRGGVPVAVELDDDFFNLPWYNPGSRSYSRREVRVMLTGLLRGADAVVTSTPYLQQRMREYNDSVHCMHNIVDTSLFTRRRSPFAEPEGTTFGYIGTRTHEEDFRPLLAPLKKLIQEGAGSVHAVFIGHVPEELQRLPHVSYLGWFPTYQNAAAALARSGANVALAPLMDVEFNRSKSAMKYLEYGACGIPGIFSDVEAYRSFIRDGENGLLVSRHAPEEWERVMRRVVERPEERERIAEAAYRDVVRNHSIDSRADDFLRLYRGIVEGARGPRRSGERPCGKQTAVVPLTLILNLYERLETSLPALASLADSIEKEARLIVVSGDRELSELLVASGGMEVIRAHGDDDDSRLNGVAEAIEAARADWALYVDGRCNVPGDLLEKLVRQIDPEVGAVGPRVAEPGSEQSVEALLDGEGCSGGLREALLARAVDQPSSPASWLDPVCVLLNLRAVESVGGIRADLIWEDALAELCVRLNHAGYKVTVANDIHVRTHAHQAPFVAPRHRRASRERLAPILADQHGKPSAAGRRDPARIFGLSDERLDIWVWAREDSDYLGECLERLERGAGVPFRLHILHAAGNETALRAAESLDARSHPLQSDRDGMPLAGMFAEEASTHVLLLHDGVMVTPGAVREMLNVLLGSAGTVVVPFSNDGSPEQRMLIDRGISLENLDELMGPRMLDRGGRDRPIGRCSGFCAMLDLNRLRTERGDPSALRLADLTGRSGRGRIVQATRAYVHVLSHPDPCPDREMAAWPGGPFDFPVPRVDEIESGRAEIVSDLAAFVSRIKPLLSALKENPGDARLLARIGLLYLGQGDIQNAMSFLGRAKRIDPFSAEVRGANHRARELLDSAVSGR